MKSKERSRVELVGFSLMLLMPFALAIVLGHSNTVRADVSLGPVADGVVARADSDGFGPDAIALDNRSAPCITDCNCVQRHCAAGQRSCSRCWMYEHTDQGCNPSRAEIQYYGLSCAQSSRPTCVTDCRCVQQKCPPGDKSCSACWMYEHTDTRCEPTGDEKSRYGWSCAAAGN